MAKFNSELKIWEASKVPYPHPMDYYFGEEMLKFCSETPDRVIQFHYEENKALTCRELKESSIKIAKNLLKMGIKADDVVGVICRNSNFLTTFIHGCVLMGAVIHPLSHQLNADNIKQLFSQTKPKLIICDLDMHVVLKKAAKFLDNPLLLIASYEIGITNCAIELMRDDDDGKEFLVPKFDKRADEKLLAILCSSGTTGIQKGVCVTHATCLRFNFKATPPRPPSRPFTFSDTHWSSGFFLQLFIAFNPNEYRIWSNDTFNVDKAIKIIEDQKISTFNIPPSSLAALLYSEKFLSCNHESLKSFVTIGSALSDSLRDKFRKIFPNKMLTVSYGMTEVFVSLTKPNECFKSNAVGSMIIHNLNVKIVNKKGESLGPNEKGEICIKTQFDFYGYYNDPEETKKAVDNEGYIKSGDLGYVDEEGILYFIERIKESFKYKNHTIFPSEIEKCILEIEGVELACVVGIYSEEKGTDLTTAVVKLSTNAKNVTKKLIIDYTSNKLPEIKHLHGGVYFFNEIPMNASGKILRKTVKENLMKM